MIEIENDNTSTIVQDKLGLTDPWYRLVMKMLRSVFQDFCGQRVIEVGCGIGGFVVNMAQEGATVIGLDISSNAVQVAKDLVKRLGLQERVDLIVGDAQCLPFKEGASDIVVCSESLEHVLNYEKAFGELLRITNQSGHLCLTVPNFLSTALPENLILLLVGQPGHVQSFFCVEKEHVFHVFKLRRLLDQKNVKLVSMQSVDFLHVPLRIRKILKIDQSLATISEKLEDFFENHFSLFRLAGANIGVLAKKE